MARVEIPITEVSETPVAYPSEVSADAVNHHYLAFNDGNVWLEVRNTDASARQFIPSTAATVGALDVKEPGIEVPASSTVVVGPLMPRVYNQKSGADAGKVYITAGNAFLRYRAFHLSPKAGRRGIAFSDSTSRVLVPTTELYTEEHMAARLQPSYTASVAASDHYLNANDGRLILEINNPDASSHDVTFIVQGLAYNSRNHRRSAGGPVEVEDNIMPIPAGAHMIVGGFHPEYYNFNDNKLPFNVTTDLLQFRCYHLPRVYDPSAGGGGV